MPFSIAAFHFCESIEDMASFTFFSCLMKPFGIFWIIAFSGFCQSGETVDETVCQFADRNIFHRPFLMFPFAINRPEYTI